MSQPRHSRVSLIALGTLASRFTGVLRSIVLAATIGSTGVWANTYATAAQIPNSIYSLIATGAVSSVLVPQIMRASLKEGGGASYINKIVTLTICATSVLCVGTIFIIPDVIGWLGSSWESAEQVSLGVTLAYWLLPQILFFSLYAVLGEILNSQGVFTPYAWAPVLNNVLCLLGLLVFMSLFGADPDGTRGTEGWTLPGQALIVGAATIGVAVQSLILFLALKKANLRFRFDFQFRGSGLGGTFRLASWTFLSVLISQIMVMLVTQSMNRAGASDAGVAAWQLTNLIIVLPHSIFIMSLITSRFPRMSQAAIQRDLPQLTAEIARLIRAAVLIMMYFVVVMSVLAFPIVRVIMFRASIETIEPVVWVLLAGLVGNLAFSLLFVLNRGFFAFGDTRTPFFVQLGQSLLVLIGIALSAAVAPSAITAAITLGLSVLLWGEVAVTFVLVRRSLGRVGGRSILVGVGQAVGASIVAGLVGAAVLAQLGGNDTNGFALESLGGALISCALVAAVAGAVYLGVLLLLKNKETQAMLRYLPRIGG